MLTVYLKVQGIDDDFDGIDIEASSTIRDLKNAILSAKTGRLIGFAPSDIKVHYIGDSPDTETIGNQESIVKKLDSYSEPAFFIVVPGSLKTIVNNDPKLTGNTPLSYKFTKDNVGGIIPSAIYPEKHDPSQIRDFNMTGTTLSPQVSRIISVANIPREIPVAKAQAYLETPIPTGRILSKLSGTIAAAIDNREFPVDFEQLTMAPHEIFEFPQEVANKLRSTIRKLKSVPVSLAILKKERRRDEIEKYVWIANGTASTDKTFNAYELCDVEEYCNQNHDCFEATRLHKYNKFFIDIDGFAPLEFTQSMFTTLESSIRYKLYTLFGKTASVLHSSAYNHKSTRVGPIGSNTTKRTHKLSYRIIFKNIHGTVDAMDFWILREIVPVMKKEFESICPVIEQSDADKVLPNGSAVLIVDRWVYYVGDRMRMMGSSKEFENRPLLPVGEIPFMDTILAYIPLGSVLLPEKHNTTNATRIPFW